jgi:NAD(P)-dependent dehydrogenase (short-subunit alcohol dehydrogenase family)
MTATYADLRDAVVLITGGANGIGEACVRAFVAQGARVHFCDVDAERGAVLAKEVGSLVRFKRVDLTQESQIVDWIGEIARDAGGVPIRALINNAARDTRHSIADTTAAEWDAMFALNLRAYFLTTREASPHMRSGASIVNFSSVTFDLGFEDIAAYVSTKGAIVGLTRASARELGKRGIRVNTLSPGWVMTERQLRDFVTPEVAARVKTLQSIPELVQPEEVAEVALFLASNASSAITGQYILADKGWAMH